MKLGTTVSVVIQHVAVDGNGVRRVMYKSVERAKTMVTGAQNVGRQRVQFVKRPLGTGWVSFDEEGEEWARGWMTTDAKALRAAVAMEAT